MNIKSVAIIEIILSGIFFGTIPIYSSLLNRFNISSIQQAFFRLIISLIILLIILLLFNKTKELKIRKTVLPFFFAHGFFLSMAFFTYLSSVTLGTPVVEAIFLTYTQPLFVIILGKLVLKEKITKMKFMAFVLSILGIVLILQIWTLVISNHDKPIIGDILAILTGFFYASYIITGRYIRMEKKYSFIATTFWSFTIGLVLLIPIWFLIRLTTTNMNIVGISLTFSSSVWSLLFGLSLFSTLIPYILLNLGLKEVKASKAGILLLVEPICVVLLGVLILQETPNFWQIIGGFLILLSVFTINYDAEEE